jgi:hypothetical protein
MIVDNLTGAWVFDKPASGAEYYIQTKRCDEHVGNDGE